jgi:hypothetical protein
LAVATARLIGRKNNLDISAIRGAILEELVLHLLEKVGYRPVVAGEEGTKPGRAGLEVAGRGEWHQIDALAAFDHSPAFMYPLRLLVEAKCYTRSRRVGIETVRNAVGVLKDISENYVSINEGRDSDGGKGPRFNYLSAIFSTSGYTANSVRYAIAHQIFLIQYQKIGIFAPITDALLSLSKAHIELSVLRGNEAEVMWRIRNEVRTGISSGLKYKHGENVFTPAGVDFMRDKIIEPLREIGGSYFGMLQGRWPLHLLSKAPLPGGAFMQADEVRCRLWGKAASKWSFVPIESREGNPDWFRLEFDIPEPILRLIRRADGNSARVAYLKRRELSTLALSGKIEGIFRQVRLRLDEGWLDELTERAGRSNRR